MTDSEPDSIEEPIDDWTRERLEMIEEPLAKDYEEALSEARSESTGVEELIEVSLTGKELGALWELYDRYKNYVMGAITTAWDGMETEIEQPEAVRAAPQIFVASAGAICRQSEYEYFAFVLYKKARDRTWTWLARRTKSLTAGTSHLTRLIRRKLREQPGQISPSDFTAELREEKDRASQTSPGYVEERVRDVLREQEMQSLDEKVYEDSGRTRADDTAISTENRTSAKEIGEALASRWKMEETWRVLMAYDRTWSEDEIETLGTGPDPAVAKRLGRTQREVEGKRKELGIEADTPRPGQVATEEEAEKIRERYEKEDLTYPELAEDYDTAPSTIGRIVRREGAYADDSSADDSSKE